MLQIGWRNVQAEGRPIEGVSRRDPFTGELRRVGADAYYHEVLSSYFSIAWTCGHSNGKRPLNMRRYWLSREDRHCMHSARAILSRAVLRLQQRGLVFGMRGGNWAGHDLAAQLAGSDLSANGRAN
jgi:hypothetical protein